MIDPSRRHFIRELGLGLAAAGVAAESLARAEAGGSEALLATDRRQAEPQRRSWAQFRLR